MFVHAPLAVLCGRELARWLARIKGANAATLRCACSLAVVLPIGGSALLYCRDAHALLARQSREAGLLLDAIDAAVTPPPGKLAVVDVEMLPIYVLEHYPVEGAMTPLNYTTFDQLRRHRPIGCMITIFDFSPDQLRFIGLVTRGSVTCPSTVLNVYVSPDDPS